MKLRLLPFSIIILIALQTKSLAQSENNSYAYCKIIYPATQTPVTSFFVNEANQIFLPLNGGIYLPKDSLWFMPPSKNYYFTSFAPNLKDTSMFVFANSSTQSDLYYLKSSVKSSIKKYPAIKLDKGLYNVIYKSGVCFVWGYSSGKSKIGILLENGVRWLLNIDGIIRQVQVNDSSDIFFAYKNSIYKLNNRQVMLTLEKEIYGFAFDNNNNIIVSGAEGVGIKRGDKLDIIATGVAGLVEYKNECLFILDRSRSSIVQLKSQMKN